MRCLGRRGAGFNHRCNTGLVTVDDGDKKQKKQAADFKK